MAIQDILARILNSGQTPQNQLAMAGQSRPFQAASMFAPSGQNDAPRMPQAPASSPMGSMAPQSAPDPMQAPAQAQTAQRAPAPAPGVGIGGFISNIVAPQRAARNQTVQWLQSQGMDEGTATLMAGNKNALQQYLIDRTQGGKPEYDFMNIDGNLVRTDKRTGAITPMGQFGEKEQPTTDDIREYQFAKNEGYGGTFNDFMLESKKAGAQNITVGGGKYGTIPTGMELIEGPEGAQLRPIPGGPVAAEMEAAQKAEQAKTQQDEAATAIVTEDIDRALEIIDTAMLPVTGAVGGALAGLGGTEARDLKALLDTVKAKAGFRELQAMRDSSPTGGALGQVTERELAMLQATIGNLEQSQSGEQLKRNLQRVRKVYEEIIHGPGGASKSGSGATSDKPVSEMTDEELEAIINGK